MSELIFAFILDPDEKSTPALILAKSIRDFGGSFAKAQIWAMFRESVTAISETVKQELVQLGVRISFFTADKEMTAFPFALKVAAAAAAEEQAARLPQLLVWMDTDSILLHPPSSLVLTANKDLGYRPVDHTLIGSRFDQPLDPFWEWVYQECQVPSAHIFPMMTSVDQQVLRPYFNAGLLVVRPAIGILQNWRREFQRLFLRPEVAPYYQQNPYHRFFIHQAVLAGVILASLPPDRLQELPPFINYPLHMHQEYPAKRRPATMNELISCRYDIAFQNPEWTHHIRVDEPLRSWLIDQGLLTDTS